MNKYLLLLISFFGFIYSCSDSELLTQGEEFQFPVESGTYAVKLDGILYDFSESTTVNSTNSATDIDGANALGQSINIYFPTILSESAFNQNQGALVTISLGAEGTFMNIDENGQLLPFSVRITDLNIAQKEVSGTFSGEIMNIVNGEKRTVTDGVFKEILFTIEDGGDGVLKAKFNNVDLDFSIDALATGNVTNATILGKNEQLQNLKIKIPQGLQVGTFTEANQVVVEVILETSQNPSDTYTNFDAASNTYLPFSLVITEITSGANGRVKGTFTGTINQFNGTASQEILITSGEIDVPVTSTN